MRRPWTLSGAAVLLAVAVTCTSGGKDATSIGSTRPDANAYVPNDNAAKSVSATSTEPVSVETGSGRAGVTIPPGALAADAEITVESRPLADFTDTNKLLNGIYDFGPDGTTFTVPVEIKLPLNGLEPSTLGELKLVYWDGASWVVEATAVTISGDSAVAAVTHFTPYGVQAAEDLQPAAPECSAPADCDSGETCEGGVCVPEVASCPPCGADTWACGDNGCGQVCGECGPFQVCRSGQCLVSPDCTSDADCNAIQRCGEDGTCVQHLCGSASECNAGWGCDDGVCVKDGSGCTPSCDGRQCGDDGCAGQCGACGPHEACNDGVCVPDGGGLCEGPEDCGPDQACVDHHCVGTECEGPEDCSAGEECRLGQCGPPCVPDCEGRQCGGDGCGGSCGECDGATFCQSGECVPEGGGGECGEPGQECPAGTSCHAGHCVPGGQVCEGPDDCPAGQQCEGGQCRPPCTASCDGKACGDDGCGGSCGACDGATFCQAGQCVPEGSGCGPCPPGWTCEGDHCVPGEPECNGPSDCPSGQTCQGGHCVPDGEPSCNGPGDCPSGQTCQAGQCVPDGSCTPDCAGKMCGDDGCGGVCGQCEANQLCLNGFICKYQCNNGPCPDGYQCAEGLCYEQ